MSLRESFRVKMICSEPEAIAAYVIWETLFQLRFRNANLALAASLLGNTTCSPDLRILVVDIGGGSTDIAFVQVGWRFRESNGSVDVSFKLLESMRFNRAGDRLSHILVTAIWHYLKTKHHLENFDLNDIDADPGFTLPNRRNFISELSNLAEEAKRAISEGREWSLDPNVEKNQLEVRFRGARRKDGQANRDGREGDPPPTPPTGRGGPPSPLRGA